MQHVLGGYRSKAKENSPFTSFSFRQDIVSGYSDGGSIIEIDISGLRKAIQSGEVTDVAILNPKQIERLINNSTVEGAYFKNKALEWAKRDEEYLIKGEIPKEFIKIRKGGEK